MLEVKSLKKRFGNLVAVKDVSFFVRKGEISGLIGPNGSGKTTTFNLISGFLRPTAGHVSLNGQSLTGHPPHLIAAHGLVRTFQLTSVYKRWTVRQNVALGHHLAFRRGMGLSDAGLQRSVDRILDFMGLREFADVQADLLPAGLQRILSVATAIATSPMLLMLDEPLAGLNPTEKANVVQKIRRLREDGLTILLVEHDLKSVMSVCESVTVINFGERIASGSPKDITANPVVIEAYLGAGHSHHA